MSIWQNIIKVARRELRIIRNRPLYLLGSVGVITFCALFYLTLMKDGLPHDIPIGVVDQDESTTSRNFYQQLDATQLGKVVHYDTYESARADLMSGKILAMCVLPKGMNDDIQASRQPKITMYTNGLYLVGGALAWKQLLYMVNLTNGAVQREALRMRGYDEQQIMGLIQPVNVDFHQIGNTTTNYGYYLSNIMLPGVVEMIVIIVLIYSLGTELKYGTSRHLLRTAGDSITSALLGKLLVWTSIFSAIGFILIVLLYHWLHFPIAGSIWNMFLDMFLMILASESIGIFIVEMLPVPRLALSIGALYSTLGFSLAGFTLPIEAMPPYIQGLAAAFPLRHYFNFFVQEVFFGAGFAGWWKEVAYLLIFLFLPAIGLNRLKRAYIYQNFPKE
ncbi:MAG: ABC transporter permease [Bacteroidales bacterium]|jgi:ABC-2 type transport system permease protein|nr:ABC transporter permease [Bacteroidales bacterium]MDY2934725.1 ABC transporter permease [Candidatus Cryptobacteroides sp.]MCI2108591.1 ABC transporter permease [Bacteroidales bacterium]MCI2134349.1 ABC transporter permease [Bacteroidales bacterium]MCI5720419.1 ABC transporter permease [Bacteroidales bacterium]